MEDCEVDLRQRLEDMDMSHAWIKAKLQVTCLYWRIVDLDAGKKDLCQRLEDRDQAKLQVNFLSWRIVELEAGKEDRGWRLEAGGQRSGQASGNFLILEDCSPGGR